MVIVFLSCVFLYLILFVVGLGPTLLLQNKENRRSIEVFIFSPIVGVMLMTIVGTYLVSSNFPVVEWAFPATILMTLGSTILCWACARKQNISYDRRSNIYFFSGLILSLILLFLPLLLGGLHYVILRGNGTDSFNYITMAFGLLTEPYHWLQGASVPQLINENPMLYLAQALLTTRWSTPMLLAWGSAVTSVPGYQLEFGFMALFFLMSFGIFFRFAERWGFSLLTSLCFGLAAACGFYGQFILDIRADSQISSVPVLLLFVLIFSDQGYVGREIIKKTILMSVVMAGVILLYAEISPMMILASFLYLLASLISKNKNFKSDLISFLVGLVIACVLVFPVHAYLIQFFVGQMSYAAHAVNTWYLAYFQWLYKASIAGYYGLGPVFACFGERAIAWEGLVILFSVPLLFLSWLSVFSVFSRKEKPLDALLIASFLLVGLLEFAYLYFSGGLWAAGKAISYAYPFIFLTTLFGLKYLRAAFKPSWYVSMSAWVFYIWIGLQIFLALMRIVFSVTSQDFQIYISNHGEYRQHHWNLKDAYQLIRDNPQPAIGVDVSNPWTFEYINFVMSPVTFVFAVNSVYDRNNNLVGAQDPVKYRYVMTDRPNKYKGAVRFSNGEFTLIQVSS